MQKICVAVCAATISIAVIITFLNVATGAGTTEDTDLDLDAAFENIQQLHHEVEAAHEQMAVAVKSSPVFVWAVNRIDVKYTADQLASMGPAVDYILEKPELTKEKSFWR